MNYDGNRVPLLCNEGLFECTDYGYGDWKHGTQQGSVDCLISMEINAELRTADRITEKVDLY